MKSVQGRCSKIKNKKKHQKLVIFTDQFLIIVVVKTQTIINIYFHLHKTHMLTYTTYTKNVKCCSLQYSIIARLLYCWFIFVGWRFFFRAMWYHSRRKDALHSFVVCLWTILWVKIMWNWWKYGGIVNLTAYIPNDCDPTDTGST